MGKDGKSSAIPERFTGRDRGVVPDSGSEPIMGVFFHFEAPEPGRPAITVQYQLAVGVCLGRAGVLGGYDGDTLGLPGGAKRRAIAMAVLLSLTFARMPGSTLR